MKSAGVHSYTIYTFNRAKVAGDLHEPMCNLKACICSVCAAYCITFEGGAVTTYCLPYHVLSHNSSKSNQINIGLFDGKSTTTVTDAKVVYRILLGRQCYSN